LIKRRLAATLVEGCQRDDAVRTLLLRLPPTLEREFVLGLYCGGLGPYPAPTVRTGSLE
jgi:hypothetical protein